MNDTMTSEKEIMNHEPSEKEYDLMVVFDSFAEELHKMDINTLNTICKKAAISVKHRLHVKESEIDKVIGMFNERNERISEDITYFEKMLEKKDNPTVGMIFAYIISELGKRMDGMGFSSQELRRMAVNLAKMLQ